MSIRLRIAAFVMALTAWFFSAAPGIAAQAGQALDTEGVKALLIGLGYEPVEVAGGYTIKRNVAGFALTISFVLSGDKSELGMNVNLGQIKDTSKVSASSWLDLLDANRDTDPAMFQFNKETGMLYLHRAIDNRDITPLLMRLELEAFCQSVADKKSLWSITQ